MSVEDQERLANAVRDVLRKASAPVELGERRDQGAYVLVPAYALDALRKVLDVEGGPERSFICVRPDLKSGEPVIAGRRLGALDMADRYWHLGESADFEILRAYDLTRAELIVACWYAAQHGSRTMRQRWAGWLRETWAATGEGVVGRDNLGWWGSWDEIPFPPHRTTPQDAAHSPVQRAESPEQATQALQGTEARQRGVARAER